LVSYWEKLKISGSREQTPKSIILKRTASILNCAALKDRAGPTCAFVTFISNGGALI
jgi:hypothetical protein